MNQQDKIIKLKPVCEIVGISASTIRRLIRKGSFPGPIAIPGTTRKGWSLNQINQYLEQIRAPQKESALPHVKTWRTDKGRVK